MKKIVLIGEYVINRKIERQLGLIFIGRIKAKMDDSTVDRTLSLQEFSDKFIVPAIREVLGEK